MTSFCVRNHPHQPIKSLSDSDLTHGPPLERVERDVGVRRVFIDAGETSPHDDDDEEEEQKVSKDAKSKTLPCKAKVSSSLKRTNSLKRSITLPKNPFVAMAKKSKTSSALKEVAGGSEGDDKPRSGASKASSSAESMRQFFNKIITQMATSTLSKTLVKSGGPSNRGKCDITEEQIAELKRRFAEESGGKVPGVIGIRNHGNTCFINAILQCLSYTDLLAEYFVMDQYKTDLKRKRRQHPLSALHKGTSTKGEVTEQLATVLKSLWSLQYDPEVSIRFKSLVEKHASQYKGNNQHDAQEFLLWLLDRVHEDLNLATRRRYKPFGSKYSSGSQSNNAESFSDEVLAAEALASYIRHNRSFIMDVFQAQFHSSLTCPACRRQSKTFEPFLCVSLPIPQKQLLPVYVTVLYIDQTPRQVKLGLTVGAHETIGDLRKMLSKDTRIPLDELLLSEIDSLCFRRSFYDSQPISVLKGSTEQNSNLYCIELPKHGNLSEGDGAFITIAWINILKEGPIEKRFGSPYTIQVSRETLYEDLQKLLLKEMSSILHDDILIGSQKVPLFKIRIIDGFDEPSYLDSSVDLPMYTLAVEQAINMCTLSDESKSPSGVPLHVKFVLEWDRPAQTQVINDETDQIEEHSSVKQVAKSPEEATSVTLQECFSLYTRAETLGQGDAWFCSACNRKQEVVKQMVLWTAPDILIIHLKRFRQSTSSGSCSKLSTAVEFPLEGFDMTPNMTHRNNEEVPTSNIHNAEQPTSNGLRMLSSLSASLRKSQRRPSHLPPSLPSDITSHHTNDNNNIYDLYAVCNHHGTDAQGGHYTATCRNPTDNQWYHFDDMHTRVLDKSDVITGDAYILFYQRRSVQSDSSSSSSSSSSSNTFDGYHWVYRMPEFRKNGTTLTAKGTQTESSSKTSNFARNSGKYATMPTKRSTEPVNCDTSHHSDGEQDDGLSSDEDERMMTSSVTQNKLAPLVSTESHDDVTGDDEDVFRPPNKNDVD